MRRLRETSEEFQRRKAAKFARWKRNEEEDPRERDPREDGCHPRFRDARRDSRLGGESDDDDDDAEYIHASVMKRE